MSLRAAHKHKSKNRKFSREELLRNLQIIGIIPTPLPPDLPPSPPASRSASPVPPVPSTSSKRKLESDARPDGDAAVKRPRPSERSHKHQQSAAQNPTPPHSHKTGIRGSEVREDGEVHDEGQSSKATHAPLPTSMAASSGLPTPVMPVRRPRRGKGNQDFDHLHDKYHLLGRMFKYSGDARFWSTYPPSHKHFKPLLNPPPPGSTYHTHGGLMSRLELVDALICFVYSLWCKDYARNRCAVMSWSSISSFVSWCKQKWMQENIGVREKAFVGLIHMVEAFIHQRKVQYAVFGHIERDVNELVNQLPKPEDLAKATRAASNGTQRAAPGMLPSPAGTLPPSSANSTPTNPSVGDGTPTGLEAGSSGSALQAPVQPTLPTAPVLQPAVPVQLDAPVPQPLLWELKEVVEDQNAASYCMKVAQQHLSLAIAREHFPRTFDRMVYSSLTAQEEHEPDMDDDEGELFWPGQCVTGEGLGWVCLMGRAMVKEFGKDVGYRGLEGIIPKPDTDDRRQGQRG